MKRLLAGMLLMIFVLLFAGCSSETEINVSVAYDDPILLYDGMRYVATDDNGRDVSVAWEVSKEEPTKTVKVFWGEKAEKDKSPNDTAEIFMSDELEGFIRYKNDFGDPALYIREGLELPDYRDNAVIEEIYIAGGKERIHFDNRIELELLTEELINASSKRNNHNERSDNVKSGYQIYLKYNACGAFFYYGWILEDIDGNLCFCANDVNEDLIYQISDSSSELLLSSGVDFSIFDD